MIVLGLSGALGHDVTRVLVDGKIIAAAKKSVLLEISTLKNKFPYEAAKFCLASWHQG